MRQVFAAGNQTMGRAVRYTCLAIAIAIDSGSATASMCNAVKKMKQLAQH